MNAVCTGTFVDDFARVALRVGDNVAVRRMKTLPRSSDRHDAEPSARLCILCLSFSRDLRRSAVPVHHAKQDHGADDHDY